jgi:hypothetical protein
VTAANIAAEEIPMTQVGVLNLAEVGKLAEVLVVGMVMQIHIVLP